MSEKLFKASPCGRILQSHPVLCISSISFCIAAWCSTLLLSAFLFLSAAPRTVTCPFCLQTPYTTLFHTLHSNSSPQSPSPPCTLSPLSNVTKSPEPHHFLLLCSYSMKYTLKKKKAHLFLISTHYLQLKTSVYSVYKSLFLQVVFSLLYS